ncbi:rCG56028, isoform CRA_b [Rattus norvegicus]|uniref:RCG56028, isoform CRA_b n=1 Tax=Rattus norvegicus TaxID=10116 RepID=A6IB05_RAT|nr:rCG56028, isoform CRA_b [Rattus norvegicus]
MRYLIAPSILVTVFLVPTLALMNTSDSHLLDGSVGTQTIHVDTFRGMVSIQDDNVLSEWNGIVDYKNVPPGQWTQTPVLSSSCYPSWGCPSVGRSLGSEPGPASLPVGSVPYRPCPPHLGIPCPPVIWDWGWGDRCIFYLVRRNNKVPVSVV